MARLTSIEARAQAVHTTIGLRRMLLVVDDAWQVETAMAFQVGGPNCAHLLTTRFPKLARHFAGLGAISVQELNPSTGLVLAPSVVAAEPTSAFALVKMVGGLPLALMLVGKYLQLETLDGQPRRLQAALTQLQRAEERLRLARFPSPLWRPPALPENTPLSLQTSIALSDVSLEDPTRQVLRALAAFPAKPNTFSEEAALAIMTPAAPELLDVLTDCGLLESQGLGRYALQQAIADYARANELEKSA